MITCHLKTRCGCTKTIQDNSDNGYPLREIKIYLTPKPISITAENIPTFDEIAPSRVFRCIRTEFGEAWYEEV